MKAGSPLLFSKRGNSMVFMNEYPILEYDDNPTATLNPPAFVSKPFDTDKMIITFFPEVIQKLLDAGKVVLEREIGGENSVFIYRFVDENILITPGAIGCPACGGNLDLFHAMGIKKVMFSGGGGVLDRSIKVGEVLLVEGAIRDDGFSYHYFPAGRVMSTDPAVNDKIAAVLDEKGVPYLRGLTWTTDAIFRETPDKVALRREEGAKIVEMEQSGCIAVSNFRGISYGALIYGGDDVSGEEWDNRSWRSRDGIRYDLVMLCKELLGVI